MNIKLLRRVKRHILAEPKRINMYFPVRVGQMGRGAPPCGTIGCIAGWAVLLAERKGREMPGLTWRRILDRREAPDMDWDDFKPIAIRRLKLTAEQAHRLFHVINWPRTFTVQYEKARTPKKMASVTAERIDHFIKTKGRE